MGNELLVLVGGSTCFIRFPIMLFVYIVSFFLLQCWAKPLTEETTTLNPVPLLPEQHKDGEEVVVKRDVAYGGVGGCGCACVNCHTQTHDQSCCDVNHHHTHEHCIEHRHHHHHIHHHPEQHVHVEHIRYVGCGCGC